MERSCDLILEYGSPVAKMGIGENWEFEDAKIGLGEGMVVDGAPVSTLGPQDTPKIGGRDGVVVHYIPALGMEAGDAEIGETEGVIVDEDGVKRIFCVPGGGLDGRQHRLGCGGDKEEDRILDLTSCQLCNLEEVDLPSMLMELDLTANRLSELDPRIGTLSYLQKLSLEQNLFRDEAVRVLALWGPFHGLQELVLRDNKLLTIPPLRNLKNLTLVDVSFNKLISLKGMSEASSTLKELYVSNNEVGEIEEIEHLQSLRVLELGSNKIRVMKGLEQLTELQQLWLGRNRIQTVNLSGLTRLLQVSLQSNRLTSMGAFQYVSSMMMGSEDGISSAMDLDGEFFVLERSSAQLSRTALSGTSMFITPVEGCEKLTELYLSHNSISVMEGLSTLQNLRVLDLASNRITAISKLDRLTRLEDLWLNDNQITSLEDIETLLQGCVDCLSTIYLERNPCASDPKYIFKLRSALPKLQQLDSRLILH